MFKQFCLVLMLCLAPFLAKAQVLVEVFTDGPVELETTPGLNLVHYDLSEPQRIRHEKAPKLSPNVDEAKRQAQAWFDSPAGLSYQAEMKRAYRGQQKLAGYRLQKTPALVFDSGKYVVYGTTDVNKAGQLYLQRVREETTK